MIKRGDMVVLKTLEEVKLEFGEDLDEIFKYTFLVEDMFYALGGTYVISAFRSGGVIFSLEGNDWSWHKRLIKYISRAEIGVYLYGTLPSFGDVLPYW